MRSSRSLRAKAPSTFRNDRVLIFGGHGLEDKMFSRVPLSENQYVAVKAKCGDISIINPSEMQDFFETEEPEIKIPRISTAATAAQIPLYSFGLERNGEFTTTDPLKVYRPKRHANNAALQMVSTVPNINLAPLAYVQLAVAEPQDISYRGVPRTGAVFGIWKSGIIPQAAEPEFPPEIQEISRILEPYYHAGHVPDDNTYRYESIVFVPGGTVKAIRSWKPFSDADADSLIVHFRKTLEAAFDESLLPFSEYIRLVMKKRMKFGIEELTVRDLASTVIDMKGMLAYITEKIGSAEPFLLINPSCRELTKGLATDIEERRVASASPRERMRGQTRRKVRKSKRQTKRYRRRR